MADGTQGAEEGGAGPLPPVGVDDVAAARRARDRERHRLARARETEAQRALRLQRDRERQRLARARARQQRTGAGSGGAIPARRPDQLASMTSQLPPRRSVTDEG